MNRPVAAFVFVLEIQGPGRRSGQFGTEWTTTSLRNHEAGPS